MQERSLMTLTRPPVEKKHRHPTRLPIFTVSQASSVRKLEVLGYHNFHTKNHIKHKSNASSTSPTPALFKWVVQLILPRRPSRGLCVFASFFYRICSLLEWFK